VTGARHIHEHPNHRKETVEVTKIAMIGAGSVVFTKNLLTDMLDYPELRDATIALHDIDMERLETAGMMARWTAKQFGANAKVEEHADRRACLDGADFVINMVLIGGPEAIVPEFDIPEKYGLKQTIADTVGIGGIFRGIRTIPFMLEMVQDMRELCPDALLINYTNPMSILTWTVYRAFPQQRVVGLCHNVQYTARDLAEYMGVALDRLSYACAGINHMTWFLRLEVDGEDAYPRLREAMQDPAIFARDKVRFEMFRQFGWFVSESSRHCAEYVPYFLKNDGEIEKYDIPVGDLKNRSALKIAKYRESRRMLLAGEALALERSVEYGSHIIHAMVTDKPRLIYGNVRNTKLIENLPEGCCVEVPVVVDRNGLRPCHVGDLPPELAAHCAPHVFVQDLVVRAALDGDRDRLYRAAMLDRHAAATLTIPQIRAMMDELIETQAAALPKGIVRTAV
jgi:alpha-galactosidase